MASILLIKLWPKLPKAARLQKLRGKANHAAPGEPIYREYGLANFYRQFELSEKVDQLKISAELKHGVLTLNLPKAEEAKPKRIDIKVA